MVGGCTPELKLDKPVFPLVRVVYHRDRKATLPKALKPPLNLPDRAISFACVCLEP